jgi:hypothetical protein
VVLVLALKAQTGGTGQDKMRESEILLEIKACGNNESLDRNRGKIVRYQPAITQRLLDSAI